MHWSRAPADASIDKSSSINSSSENTHHVYNSCVSSETTVVPGLFWFRDEPPKVLPTFSNDHSYEEDEPITTTPTSVSSNSQKNARPLVSGLPWSPHPRLTLLPIGLNDRHVPGSHGDRKLLLAACRAMPPNANRPPAALVTFHHSQKLGWYVCFLFSTSY